ncbi:TPA: hypothetical protein I0F65_RS09180 [Enterococcus faecalis]|uniref:hypothetical protein n=1 Tax=Enterococcus faecalis TaxID=1351 RepID=UPI00115ABBFE|nr:hypothetical protein [Enterococcus faecalis]HBI1662525.1 hypothetical protein [Enterococcus faecalis]HBI1691368.1 hypothetical protein [Enterococcus faecalis]HBI1696762.1 hypothetical protein [Enterococcus faecalis]HBI1699929.1 hypothetical protein [Enterococcus faecalis]HBI1705620.1 hypothetical protein [Enterococcus faecalis]
MTKVFEDEFMDWQEDMIAVANDFIEGRAEKIYLYSSIEEGGYFFNIFFQINGKVVTMGKVNAVLNSGEELYDVSEDRRFAVLDMGLEDLMKIEEVCKEYKKPIPTEFKLIYNVETTSFNTKYKYDLQYSNNDALTDYDLFMSWYEEVKKEVENPPL